jgi:hypothetical protein
LAWNLALVGICLLVSVGAMTPYIPMIVSSQGTGAFFSWLYPALRVAGSTICTICTQLLLQTRIHEILSQQTSDMPFASAYAWILRIALLLGSGATVAGYIGCFNNVQSASSHETFLWLGLEAFLSLLRVLLWSLNPQFDEDTGLVISIEGGIRPTAQATTSCAYDTHISTGGAFIATSEDEFFEMMQEKMQCRVDPQLTNSWRAVRPHYTTALTHDARTLYLLVTVMTDLSASIASNSGCYVIIQRKGSSDVVVHRARYEWVLATGEVKIELMEELPYYDAAGLEEDTLALLKSVAGHTRSVIEYFDDPSVKYPEIAISWSGNAREVRKEHLPPDGGGMEMSSTVTFGNLEEERLLRRRENV